MLILRCKERVKHQERARIVWERLDLAQRALSKGNASLARHHAEKVLTLTRDKSEFRWHREEAMRLVKATE